VVLRVRSQLITTFGGVIGLDHGAAFRMAEALSVPLPLLAEMLPDLEGALLTALDRNQPDDQEDPDP